MQQISSSKGSNDQNKRKFRETLNWMWKKNGAEKKGSTYLKHKNEASGNHFNMKSKQIPFYNSSIKPEKTVFDTSFRSI